MEILLLRHGLTTGNAAKRYVGSTDEPLSRVGEALVRVARRFPGVKKVYVSPMLRARQTAALRFPDAEFVTVPGLNEMDFGEFEYHTAEEMEHDTAYRKWVDGDCRSDCPGGESIFTFQERVCMAFDSLVRAAIAQGETTLILVAHGGVIMAILDRYSVPHKSYYDWFVDNNCGYRAGLNRETWASDPRIISIEYVEA